MEGMLPRVKIVQNNLDYIVVVQNVWIRIVSIDHWICRILTGSENSV